MKSPTPTVTPKRAQQKSLAQPTGTTPKSARVGDSDARTFAPAQMDPVKRHMLIAQAAYYRAEKRGFAAGDELKDWLEAEAEVRQLLGQ